MSKYIIRIILVVLLALSLEAKAGRGMAFPGKDWKEATPESQGIDSAKLNAAISYLKNNSGRDGVRELVVIRNGYMVFKGTNIDKVHGVWSLTKSFTSTVLGLLIDDGRTTLDTPAKEYVSSMAASYPTVTPRHFTTMTSGYYAVGDEPRGSYKHGPSPTPFKPSDKPLFTPPGSKYAYWDSAMNQFANVLTHIAGEPIEALFKRKIADPIGMNPGKWDWGDFGEVHGIVVNGGSGNNNKHVQISARELARLGHLFLNRGKWKGKQLFSSAWVEQATRAQVPASLPLENLSGADGRGVYGYNWWVNDIKHDGKRKWPGAPPGTYSASGYNNNDMFVIPEWDMVIVRLGLDQTEFKITDTIYGTFIQKLGQAIKDVTTEGNVLSAVRLVSVQTAELTHGPMIGHTTNTTTRVWVRADGPCGLHVRAVPKIKGKTIFTEKFHLVESENFCGSVLLKGLSPSTKYSYRVFLGNKEQPSSVIQEFRTFPERRYRGVVRVGFGHSLTGPGEQIIWRSIAKKKPHLFILMGDNIYSNTTDPRKQRRMYLQFRADPHFRAFAATTPIYAIWDDHDYGVNNSDLTQPGKEKSLDTFNEIWANPSSQAGQAKGIWTRFTVGGADFFLLDVRYHRSPNTEPDGPNKTMLGFEQRAWLLERLTESSAVFKFLVSGSSWNCGGVESWNHQFTHEYDAILAEIMKKRISGIILLGGDQHFHKIGVRPRESWGGYDLHEWMAGQLWNKEETQKRVGTLRGFGLITIDTRTAPATTRLEFFDEHGQPRLGRRIPYTTTGALRTLWDSPPGVTKEVPRSIDGELRPKTCGPLWEALPTTTGETLTENDLNWPR